jgi:hypothetical protein
MAAHVRSKFAGLKTFSTTPYQLHQAQTTEIATGAPFNAFETQLIKPFDQNFRDVC